MPPFIGSSLTAIRKCSDWSNYLIVESGMPQPLEAMSAYREICEWLVGYCSGYFPSVAGSVAQFASQSAEIDKYLERAIVPSTVMVGAVEQHPDPLVLLNSGIKFMSQDMGRLLSNISGKDAHSVADYASVSARVE